MNIMDKTPAKITLHIDGMTWEQVREMIEERYGALMWDRKSTAYPTDSVVVRMAFAEPAGNVAQRAIGKAAPQQEAPAVGNSGFDHKTAADFLTGNTVSDEAMRKFVAASRWAHDDRVGLQATLLSVRRELASRDAEIALLKTALMDAEAAPKQDAPQNCTCPSGDGSLRWPCPAHPAPQQEAQEPVGHLRMGPKEEFVATQRAEELGIDVWHPVYTSQQPSPAAQGDALSQSASDVLDEIQRLARFADAATRMASHDMRNNMETLAEELTNLLAAAPAQLAQRGDVLDASRYRWLREASVDRQGTRVIIDERPRFLERLDATIDAARAAQEGK